MIRFFTRHFHVLILFMATCVFQSGCGTKLDHAPVQSEPSIEPKEHFQNYEVYAGELTRNWVRQQNNIPSLPDSASLKGAVREWEGNPSIGLYVIQTFEGEQWTAQQHFYVFDVAGNRVEELSLSAKGPLSSPRILIGNDTNVIFDLYVSERHPIMLIYSLRTRRLETLTPGYAPVVSNNHRSLAFLRSNNNGFHSIHVLNPLNSEVTTVTSLWESDPGSGISFDYRWSEDSKALLLKGRHRGYTRKQTTVRELGLIWFPAQGKGFELNSKQ